MWIHLRPGLRSIAALGLVVLTAAACSGGATSTSTPTAAAPLATAATTPANATQSTGQAGTGTSDPCVLLTAADAQGAMGLPIATTYRNDDGVANVCQYTSADSDHWVALSLYDNSMDKAQFDLARQRSDQEAPVTGVGSDAYFNADSETLSVWQNGTDFGIQVAEHGDATPAQTQAAATKAALAVLARL